MDERLRRILSEQAGAGFADLAGSELGATIRVSDRLLNQLIAAALPANSPLRSVTVRSHAGNRMDVSLAVAKPSFLPPIPLTLAVDRQPTLPDDPVLVFRVAGLAGGMMHLAGPLIGRVGALAPGVRLDGERLLVDLRAVSQQFGYARLLATVQQLAVTTENGRLGVVIVARQP